MPEQIRIAIENSGLNLSPSHLQELIDIYPYIEPMLLRIRADQEKTTEPAHLFSAVRVGLHS